MPNRATAKRLVYLILFAFTFPCTITPASAKPDEIAAAEYQIRSAELLQILKGSKTEETFFASSFLEAVPLSQFRTLLAQLRSQYGEPLFVKRVIPASDHDGTIEFQFEKAVVAMRMVIDRNPPKPVIGLLVTGANVSEDTIDKVIQDFEKLPGTAGFQIVELSGTGNGLNIGVNQRHAFAIGSVFKLYVLAELSFQISKGERRWSDVALVTERSLPSGILQNWPDNTPMTLQGLATLMITASDNTATDQLIDEIGRDRLEMTVMTSGSKNDLKTLPLLKTREAFALKMPDREKLRRQYINASLGERKRILAQNQDQLAIGSIAIANLANEPQHIETIEWFASPADVVGLLVLMHRRNETVLKNILSSNPVIPPGDAKRWKYLGGKGGSEPGVISYAFLAISKKGTDYAISGSWNNPEAPVNNAVFLSLMNRLLNLVTEMES